MMDTADCEISRPGKATCRRSVSGAIAPAGIAPHRLAFSDEILKEVVSKNDRGCQNQEAGNHVFANSATVCLP